MTEPPKPQLQGGRLHRLGGLTPGFNYLGRDHLCPSTNTKNSTPVSCSHHRSEPDAVIGVWIWEEERRSALSCRTIQPFSIPRYVWPAASSIDVITGVDAVLPSKLSSKSSLSSF